MPPEEPLPPRYLAARMIREYVTPNPGGEFVTDLIAAPGAETAATQVIAGSAPRDDQTPRDSVNPPDDGTRPLEWAPREPAPKKHRTGLWVGLGVGALVLGGAAASTILIAPGTTIAGIPVGGLTPGAATDVLSSHLANTEIVLTDVGGDIVITGAELGATMDAEALAADAFAAHPMWNVTSWMSDPIPATITLDPQTAESTLRAAIPGSYSDAVDATVVFDEASATYVTTEAVPGTGIDLDALTAAISDTLADGGDTVSFSGEPTEAAAAITDEEATATASTLNTMLGTIGFYVGEERTVPVAPAIAAGWLSVIDEGGELSIAADETAIQATVDTLPELVNRAPVNAEAIVNSSGEVLRELTAGVNGRELADTSGVAADFAAQLEAGQANYELTVNETAFETTTLLRRIEINLSQQRTYLFENGAVVNSYAISSGLPGTPTPTGNFTVFAHTAMQDMIGDDYVTEDVPWNTWFAPDIAFHGAYWHNNFGQQMSHGCVNMPVHIAKYVYDWAPVGVEVSVYW